MNFDEIIKGLLSNKKERWLVTGAAGFIGSHIAEFLLKNNQTVHTLDNFATGKKENIEYLFDVQKKFGGELSFFELDITDPRELPKAFDGVTKVIHQAALGSVPRSIECPTDSHAANVTGFINILNESRNSKIKRVVYASSSSVYGDSTELPKFEEKTGKVLSPYAATKMCNEIYADSYVSCYDMTMVGLRYFNVFGPRQDPDGPYAAVIPKWIDAVQRGEPCIINGDGETSRDFCYVYNVVYANIASALIESLPNKHEVLNIACGEKTTLNQLYELIAENVLALKLVDEVKAPEYRDFRLGDIKHSLADISKARSIIAFEPFVNVSAGMRDTVRAYFGINE